MGTFRLFRQHFILILLQAYRDGYGKISKGQALALVTANVNKLLGLDESSASGELVAYQGGDFFSTGAKVVGALSKGRGVAEVF